MDDNRNKVPRPTLKSQEREQEIERLRAQLTKAGNRINELENVKPDPFDSGSGFVVIAAVRYALTRASYAVGLVAEWTLARWSRLSNSNKQIIRRDVREELDQEHGRFCGHDMDRRTWEHFLLMTCRCGGTGSVPDHHGGTKACKDCASRQSTS